MANPHALSRNAMEQHINEGRSVLYNGRTIATIAGLPSAAELAKGDPDAEKAAKADLHAEMEQLRARLAMLEGEGEGEGEDGQPRKRGPGRPPKHAGEPKPEGDDKGEGDGKPGDAKLTDPPVKPHK